MSTAVRTPSSRTGLTALALAIALALALTLLPGSALAAGLLPPPQYAQTPEDGVAGAGAGRFKIPQGAAADRNLPGHVFVVDPGTRRVNELSAWGAFVKAWGWGVDASGPAEELQTCTTQSGCQEGSQGGGAGQMRQPQAVGVDGAGNVYVMEFGNHRVQKFAPGPEGGQAQFLLAFGWGVRDGSAEAQTCGPAASPPSAGCQEGIAGTGAGQFGNAVFARRMAVCPSGQVFVGEGERVQRFGPDGSFAEEIAMPAGKSVRALAADGGAGGACRLYVAFTGEADVRKMKPTGPAAQFEAPEFKGESAAVGPASLAVDGTGNLYVGVDPGGGDPARELKYGKEPARVLKYDASGACLLCGGDGEEEEVKNKETQEMEVVGMPGFDRSSASQINAVGATSACGSDEAFPVHFSPSPERAFLRAYGEHPDPAKCEPPQRPPSIDSQFAVAVEATTASLKAQINPHFWSGSVGTTSFYVQYASAACIEGGGWEAPCVASVPGPPGRVLEGGAVGVDVSTSAITLEGLAPATSYRYRFVAEGSGAPGEAAIGAGGTPGSPGAAGTVNTYAPPAVTPCPANEGFRAGASAALPDCRAYEMVSPLDKEGGDILSLLELTTNLPAVLQQSSADGQRLAYGSYRSFGGAPSAPYTTQYVATREAGVGWASHAISPPHEESIYRPAVNLDTEARALSGDLCSAWMQSYAEPPLGPGAPAGVSDLYRRSDEQCGGPTYTALNTTAPPNLSEGFFGGSNVFKIELQGVSADGQVAAFRANDVLAAGGTAGATLAGLSQLYVAGPGGAERFACVLPGGGEWTQACTAGGAVVSAAGENRKAQLAGALAEDGQSLFWTAVPSVPFAVGAGKIYQRRNPLGEGGECEGPAAPCTVAVSQGGEEDAGTSASQFEAAARDGSRALYLTGGRLYEWRAGDEATELIAGQVVNSILGASADASRVYFASREALTGPNAEGAAPAAGQANLYLHEAGEPGSTRFIGILEGGDLAPGGLSPIAAEPRFHTARVSPDGSAAAFMSVAPLTGYDNTDLQSGEADAEVFLYSASANGGQGALRCASCNPGGARPRGRFHKEGQDAIWAAARIAVPANSLYASRLLADNGRRLYFDSFDALVPADTNGKADVYQWEAAGEGKCETASPTYSAQNGGCVDLISSGQASLDAEFADASPSGADVFFTTVASLVPQDYGLRDVYDARVDGGLPPPRPAAAGCEGEACQPAAQGPDGRTPASAAFRGPGNVRAQGGGASRCTASAHRARSLSKRAKRLRRGAARTAAGNRRRAAAMRRRAERLTKAARKQSKRARRCRARSRKDRRTSK